MLVTAFFGMKHRITCVLYFGTLGILFMLLCLCGTSGSGE